MRDDVAVYILSHKRAREQYSLKMFRKTGYTGRIYIVVDTSDTQIDQYKALYGSSVRVFDKMDYEGTFDKMINGPDLFGISYARNAILDMARKDNVRYAIMADDDITEVRYRFESGGKLRGKRINKMDQVIEALVNYMESANLFILGLTHAGKYLGGIESQAWKNKMHRNFNQLFLIDTSVDAKFRGQFQEDLQMLLDSLISGRLVYQTSILSFVSPVQASNSGGMMAAYVESGAYISNFMSFMAHPGALKIDIKKGRVSIRRKSDAKGPLLLSEKWRKTHA